MFKNRIREKIHKYGRLKDTAEIIKKVTGEELNPKYYIDYLKEKYSKIYKIQVDIFKILLYYNSNKKNLMFKNRIREKIKEVNKWDYWMM